MTSTYTTLQTETVAALMDAYVDAEAIAMIASSLREAGVEPDPVKFRNAELGQRLLDYRQSYGSMSLRQDIMALAVLAEEVWEALPSFITDECLVCWDFEFCPEAIRLRFVEDRHGEDFKRALREWTETYAKAEAERIKARSEAA
ncbi:hypothetical protein JIX59_03670 [Brevundimonas diminuta]|uniref:hypothetical protein n=1 Tax=Brevundimonas diminuta TaxID=293 RepID=UPI001906BCAE|nr:hypothetical protein [Brevundimonas diminuta]MBK1968431.1 hypothetical protein [Brevundimonas diminuta]